MSRDAGIFCLRDAPDGALRAGAAELFSAMVFSMAASGAASIRRILLIGTRPLDICTYVGPTGIGCDGSRELDAEARLREVGLALSGLESYSDSWDGLGNEKDAAAAIGLDRPDCSPAASDAALSGLLALAFLGIAVVCGFEYCSHEHSVFVCSKMVNKSREPP